MGNDDCEKSGDNRHVGTERAESCRQASSVSPGLLHSHPSEHHLLIRRDQGREQCVFNCVFVIKITNANKMEGQHQHRSEEPLVVTNTLHICNHLVETQSSSKGPLGNTARPTRRVSILCSAVRTDTVFRLPLKCLYSASDHMLSVAI
uniref:Uncharacterized protein n=1 Tax=Molossus molossus TaxID=27622 RepID=A0A7J8GRU0_MOLMO|nr:hypothetical protein HJG59_011360 [Molossus molossus]